MPDLKNDKLTPAEGGSGLDIDNVYTDLSKDIMKYEKPYSFFFISGSEAGLINELNPVLYVLNVDLDKATSLAFVPY